MIRPKCNTFSCRLAAARLRARDDDRGRGKAAARWTARWRRCLPAHDAGGLVFVPGPCPATVALILCLLLPAGCTRTPPADPEKSTSSAQTAPADPAPPPPVQATAAEQLAAQIERAVQHARFARFSAAESELRQALRIDGDDPQALHLLARILNIEGRRWEANQLLFRALQTEQFTVEDLLLLGTPDELYEDEESIQAAREAAPDDVRPQIGAARILRRHNQDQQALSLLQDIVDREPQLLEAQAQLGSLLVDRDQDEQFLRWQARLPEEAGQHPEIWFVRGAWAERHDQLSAAARCYWEALRRAPNHRRACYQLGLVLNRLDRGDVAPRFFARAQALADLELVLHEMYFKGPEPKLTREALRLTEQLGQIWERWGWQVAVASFDPADEAAAKTRDELRNPAPGEPAADA